MLLADRKKIEASLQLGDKSKIAMATKTTSNTVRKWFRGASDNFAISEAVNALYKKRVEQAKQASKEVIK